MRCTCIGLLSCGIISACVFVRMYMCAPVQPCTCHTSSHSTPPPCLTHTPHHTLTPHTPHPTNPCKSAPCATLPRGHCCWCWSHGTLHAVLWFFHYEEFHDTACVCISHLLHSIPYLQLSWCVFPVCVLLMLFRCMMCNVCMCI